MTAGPAIRDAASVIVLRDGAVLMGQRGAKAAFMPSKFVFPGGAVDPGDADIPLAHPLPPDCIRRLGGSIVSPDALAAAAVRELAEETGLLLGEAGAWPGTVPQGWAIFAEAGCRPSARGLRHVFRAITPPGRSRRFDARFFVVDADHVLGDPDDFSRACDELSNLQWIALDQVQAFDLPFITEVVLAEVAEFAETGRIDSVPFFDNSDTISAFRRIP